MRKNGTRRCGSQGVTRSGLPGKMPVFLIRRSRRADFPRGPGRSFSARMRLFLSAPAGIAVRAIAPFVQDKFHDPAVLCVDEAGTFVIPILSGHVGGANRLAEFVAGGIGAVPVVTTATDVERKFAVDVFAKDHGLVITDRVLAKRISADILAEEPVGVFSDFGFSGWKKIPEGLFRDRLCKRNIRITVSDREKDGIPSDRVLRLVPRCVALGIGCKRGLPRRRSERRWRTL